MVRSIARLSAAVLACVFLTAAPPVLAAQRPDPLGQLVAEALRTNLGLEGERLAERRVAAEVREARGLFFPSLGSRDARATRRLARDRRRRPL